MVAPLDMLICTSVSSSSFTDDTADFSSEVVGAWISRTPNDSDEVVKATGLSSASSWGQSVVTAVRGRALPEQADSADKQLVTGPVSTLDDLGLVPGFPITAG